MRVLNLGILAHVDAGKTTLTERLLHSAGVIDTVGSVDAGSTQTDFLPLERQRGITIKSAVVNFTIDDVGVNLIDTPGHPDFIAEVERILCTLDGAVVVISAVEGVQAQTRVLMRTLHRLRIPTLFFVNKIDRAGAADERLIESISLRLTPACVPMGSVRDIGTRTARFSPFDANDPRLEDRMVDVVADQDETFLEAYATGDGMLNAAEVRRRLVELTAEGTAHPVYFGSALTGKGVDDLLTAIPQLLPAREPPVTGDLAGTVFKIERGPSGEKIAFVRIFSGSLHARDVVHHPRGDDKVTAMTLFENGHSVPYRQLTAGRIGRVWGLSSARIGDSIGSSPAPPAAHYFAPPTLETAIAPAKPDEKARLHAALTALAEQDPLINLRQDDLRGELYVSLYGEVQKEVIQATLVLEFGVEAAFSRTTQICIERVCGTGRAVEVMRKDGNPFLATIGLTVEPRAEGSGIEFRLEADLNSMPRYVYSSTDLFGAAMREYVEDTLREGLKGWQVTDCLVRMTGCDYSAPSTGARDYRLLTPLVLMAALKDAGTVACEPVSAFRLELQPDCLPAVLSLIRRLDATTTGSETLGEVSILHGRIPAERVHEMRQMIPSLTRGEGVLEVEFGGYKSLDPENSPSRPRSDLNPLNRKEYLLRLAGRI
jgi:ribosomal protection tetracycline resistance protein